MIGFGELRRLAVERGVLVDSIERAYALTWLARSLFAEGSLADSLVLRGEAALGLAHFLDYTPPDALDLQLVREWDEAKWQASLAGAARLSEAAGGPRLTLDSLDRTEARFQFTGPLGRRSAAQPHLIARWSQTPAKLPPVEGSLQSAFSDLPVSQVRTVSLEELAAERLAVLRRAPRIRDVYDLWFILAHAGPRLDRPATRTLMGEIARAKSAPLPSPYELWGTGYRAILARGWENALKSLRGHPSLDEAEAQINYWLAETT